MKDNWVYLPAVLKLPSVAVRFELPLSQQLISHSFLKRLLSSQQLLDSSQRQRLQSHFQGYLQISVLLFTYTTPFRRASSHPAVQGDCGSRAGNIQKTLGKTFLFVFSPCQGHCLGGKWMQRRKRGGKFRNASNWLQITLFPKFSWRTKDLNFSIRCSVKHSIFRFLYYDCPRNVSDREFEIQEIKGTQRIWVQFARTVIRRNCTQHVICRRNPLNDVHSVCAVF